MSFAIVAVALVVALGFALYLWARAHERRARERRALRWFSHSEHPAEHLRDDWEADLVAMTVTYARFDSESPGNEPPVLTFALRRNARGIWKTKLTPEAQAERLEWLELQLGGKLYSPTLRERYELERTTLADGKVRWTALDARVAAPLESQYQRFLLHWREG